MKLELTNNRGNMDKVHITNQMIKEIKKLSSGSSDDQAIGKFIVDIMFEESDHPKGWSFTKLYEKKLEEYLQCGDDDAD
jgi:hypothetical protein